MGVLNSGASLKRKVATRQIPAGAKHRAAIRFIRVSVERHHLLWDFVESLVVRKIQHGALFCGSGNQIALGTLETEGA